MPRKKNAFFMFVINYRNEEIKQGKPSRDIQELCHTLTPVWNVSNH